MSRYHFVKVFCVISFALISLEIAESANEDSPSKLKTSPSHMKSGILRYRTSKKDTSKSLILTSGCIPVLRAVKLSKDPKSPFFGKCVKIKQCDGGCSSELLQCQPTSKIERNISVSEFHNEADKSVPMTSLMNEKITIYEHLACQCGCKLQENDCSKNHIYNEDTCQCDCKKEFDKNKCSGLHQAWDPSRCDCDSLIFLNF